MQPLPRWCTAPLLVLMVMLTMLSAIPESASATLSSPPMGTTDRGQIQAGPVAISMKAPGPQPNTPQPIDNGDSTIDIGPVVRAEVGSLDTTGTPPPNQLADEPEEYAVGSTRQFVVRNTIRNQYQLADYEVRLISDEVEVWVQQDLNYYNRDGSINVIHPDARDAEYITQERIELLAAAAARIIPVDVEYFGDYNSRDGSNATLPEQLGLPADYYAGPGKRVIILVSNIRDGNYYDPINNPSYVTGFFSPTVNRYADRNIITVESKAWNRLIGSPVYDNEATIAHEFQHLINFDLSPDEELWANEGRSELAEFINGYRPTSERHRTQWSDFPENSLTLWGDQNDDPDQNFESLADYQIAYWFFLYLAGRIQDAGIHAADNQFLKDVAGLTRDPASGAASIDNMLETIGAPFRFRQVFDDFRIAMLFGGTSDQTGWGDYISTYQAPSGVPIAPLDIGRLRHGLNFEGYDKPGVSQGSSDYVEIGWSPSMTNGMQIRFDGDSPLESTAWKVITATATGITPTGDVTGTVLYSGHTDQTDNFMILPVSVPATGDQRLAFDTLYNIEHTWDFGFTQVTTDTIGATGFKSLALSGTITAIDPQAEPIIQANVPGFSGVSGSQDAPSWVHVEYDLADYAGQDILLAFRYSTDGASAGTIGGPPAPGWYVDNLKVGDTALFTDEAAVPANAKSIAQARNQRARFMLNLVTFADTNGPAIGNVYAVPLNDDADGTFSMDTLLKDPGFDEAGERIVAIISYVPAPRDPDIIASGPVTTGSYSLTGLPPSLYTSRARLLGTASNTSILSPRVYPGDTFTVTVTVDNLGRNDDLKTTGPVDAYVAVPLPENTTFDPQSLQASLSASNITYTTSLQNVDNGLPATPGVYWHGPVTRTADLSFRLRAAAPLAIGTVITPTAHIANGPFSSNPSQRFTDLFRPVSVVSPFALSSAMATPTARVGDTAIFTYTLINADDQTRDMTFRFQIPDGTSLERVNVNLRDPRSQTSAGGTFELGLSVPSFARTGLTTVVAVELKLEPGFHGDMLNPMAELLQPGSTISFLATPLELAVPGGATTIEWNRVYIPVISNEAGNAS